MKVVISQPRYLPAINYLQRLFFADIFVILDTVQRQPRGWENRNKLLLPDPKWLTIPISSSRRENISKTKVANIDWIQEHIDMIKINYKKHPFFQEELLYKWFDGVVEEALNREMMFTPIVIKVMLNVCETFDFKPNLVFATNFEENHKISSSGPQKLLDICENIHASQYISGPNGRNYGLDDIFKNSQIQLAYHEFHFPKYEQKTQKEFHAFLAFPDIVFSIGIEKVKAIIQASPSLI